MILDTWFTHNAVVLPQFGCAHPKNQTKALWYLHFYESKQITLTQDLKWSLEQCSALQVWFNSRGNLICYFVLYITCPLSPSEQWKKQNKTNKTKQKTKQKQNKKQLKKHGCQQSFHYSVSMVWYDHAQLINIQNGFEYLRIGWCWVAYNEYRIPLQEHSPHGLVEASYIKIPDVEALEKWKCIKKSVWIPGYQGYILLLQTNCKLHNSL